ncbi:hypothetical protein BDM02DRAFT_3132478 [Thelephora ganbajun]|uniref:Uncharacterized protein n=1 Tax=Thelephora ganbajun TaxID=370292 RepID=A0ACB6Z1J1_THEGA|nr:hypothetical protein BDM02DRAFT_3132478 [Thelephora ganbajun]
MERKIDNEMMKVQLDTEKTRTDTETLTTQVNNMLKVIDVIAKSSSDGVKISQRIRQATDRIITDVNAVKNKTPAIMVTGEGQQIMQLAAPGHKELQKLLSTVHTIKGQLDTIHNKNVKLTKVMSHKSSVLPQQVPQEPANLTKGVEFFFNKLNSIPDEVVVWWAKVISWGGWGPIGPQNKPTSCNSAWLIEQKKIWIADAI